MLKQQISSLSIWKKGDQRAPHKPLLLLYALGRVQKDRAKEFGYDEVRNRLSYLLREYGPPRKSYHPEEPFVRLRNDGGIWELNFPIQNSEIKDKYLLQEGFVGRFNPKVQALLENNPALIIELSFLILNEHFPETMHEDILNDVGLNPNLRLIKSRARDPKFREHILKAYEYKCAVCDFQVRLGDILVGIEAAHIQWHQAGGPDEENNGLALCSMHHKLFDRGVFTIDHDTRRFLVSDQANGNGGFNEWLMKYHGQSIHMPISPDYQPKGTYLQWHFKEVFRGSKRYSY
jgi:putative restriction endonuclease